MNTESHPVTSPARVRGFTLIELLTVIAIIGILAAILIPTVSAVKTASSNAKTKVRFSQWASALSDFKQQYGYYPNFGGGATPPVADTVVNLGTNSAARNLFYEILAGKQVNGTPLATGSSALTQNKRRQSFYTFAADELVTASNAVTSLRDAFGNQEIILVMDYDYNNLIDKNTVTTSVRQGNDAEGFGATVALTAPADDVRAGVIFYSAGKGEKATDIVKSWE